VPDLGGRLARVVARGQRVGAPAAVLEREALDRVELGAQDRGLVAGLALLALVLGLARRQGGRGGDRAGVEDRVAAGVQQGRRRRGRRLPVLLRVRGLLERLGVRVGVAQARAAGLAVLRELVGEGGLGVGVRAAVADVCLVAGFFGAEEGGCGGRAARV
jgi:hypothetical protein